MKKLMILAVLAALAFGAQANVALQFNLTCENIPVSFDKITGDSYFCLIDPAKGEILAYVQPKEFNSEKTQVYDLGGHDDYQSTYANNTTHESKTIKINGKNYTVNDHMIVGGSSTVVYDRFNGSWNYASKEGTATEKDVIFKVTANSSNADTESILSAYSGKSEDTSLIAIIWDEKKDYYQEYKVGVTGNSTPILFSAKGPYNSVPEPTSAMLLLLGFAGLALRRKVA